MKYLSDKHLCRFSIKFFLQKCKRIFFINTFDIHQKNLSSKFYQSWKFVHTSIAISRTRDQEQSTVKARMFDFNDFSICDMWECHKLNIVKQLCPMYQSFHNTTGRDTNDGESAWVKCNKFLLYFTSYVIYLSTSITQSFFWFHKLFIYVFLFLRTNARSS